MHRVKTTWIAAVLLLALAAGGEAQTVTGSITGTVRDEQGGVLPGVTVSLAGRQGTRTSVTDERGVYRFVGIDPGTYTLTASAEGHETVTVVEVSVVAGAAVTVDVELPVAVRAAVLGDRQGQLTALLNSVGVVASEIGWADTHVLEDLDVVVINHPADPGRDAFLAFLDEQILQLLPNAFRTIGSGCEESSIAIVRRIMLLDKPAHVDVALPQAGLESAPGFFGLRLLHRYCSGRTAGRDARPTFSKEPDFAPNPLRSFPCIYCSCRGRCRPGS